MNYFLSIFKIIFSLRQKTILSSITTLKDTIKLFEMCVILMFIVVFLISYNNYLL